MIKVSIFALLVLALQINGQTTVAPASEVTTGVTTGNTPSEVTTGITTGQSAAGTTGSSSTSGGAVRFVNNLDQAVIIQINNVANTTVAAQTVTAYQNVNGNSAVVQLFAQNGTALLPQQQLVNFPNFYATVALVVVNASSDSPRLVPIIFNEANSGIFNASSSNAYVRYIDLSPGPRYTSLNANGSPIVSYVGFLEGSNYTAVSTANLQAGITISETETANAPFTISNLPTFAAGNAYTVFFFNNRTASPPNGVAVFDRQAIPPVVATTGALTTGSSTTSVTTARVGTTGLSTTSRATTGITTAVAGSTTGTTGENVNSVGKLAAFGLFSAVVAVLAI